MPKPSKKLLLLFISVVIYIYKKNNLSHLHIFCFSLEDTLCEETVDWPLDIDDLLKFSFEVAQGLDFLAAKNVSDFSSKTQQQKNIWNKNKNTRHHLEQRLLLNRATYVVGKKSPT